MRNETATARRRNAYGKHPACIIQIFQSPVRTGIYAGRVFLYTTCSVMYARTLYRAMRSHSLAAAVMLPPVRTQPRRGRGHTTDDDAPEPARDLRATTVTRATTPVYITVPLCVLFTLDKRVHARAGLLFGVSYRVYVMLLLCIRSVCCD